MSIEPIRFANGTTLVIDQTLLPEKEVWVECRSVEEIAHAIRTMQVRGAPLIGVSAAFGLAMHASSGPATAREFLDGFESAARLLRATRPTAVNLFWAIDRMCRVARSSADLSQEQRAAALLAEAEGIRTEDLDMCRRIGRFGASLIEDGETVMTHCNAGALATAGYGTALGAFRAAREAGKTIHVLARETRPLLQGARLTAWELQKDGVPVTVVPDNAGAHLLGAGEVDRVIVGADRIAGNGDTANKIGTYDLAIVAREHGIPFHVAAPYSTVDFSLEDGSGIPIEERGESEVTQLTGQRVVPEGVPVRNPAFDVTPARYITSIITEAGIAHPPLVVSLAALLKTRSS